MENNFINKEIARLLCGRVIGRGMSRTVYVNNLDPTTVIKIEEHTQSFQNVREWEYWDENKEFKPVAEWLAPCVAISPCGTVLVQKRAYPADPKLYPKTIPHFFTDTKYQNFGLINKKLVCFDYGSIPMSRGIIVIKKKTKMQKVGWWGDKEID